VPWPLTIVKHRRRAPAALAPAAIPFSQQLGDLPLETRDAGFELVHALAEGRHFALEELARAIAYPLIDLRRRLLQRFPREPVVEHDADPFLENPKPGRITYDPDAPIVTRTRGAMPTAA
jgi:hypothetical protein